MLASSSGLLAQVAAIDLIATELELIGAGPWKAESIALATIELADRLALRGFQAYGEIFLAEIRSQLGDASGAENLVATAIARPESAPEVHAGAAMVRATSAVVAGDLSAAAEHSDAMADLLAAHASSALVHWWGLWLLLRVIDGRAVDEARRTFGAAQAGRRVVNEGAAAYADAVTAGRAGDRWSPPRSQLDAVDRGADQAPRPGRPQDV